MTAAWALIQPHGAVEGESAPRLKNMKYAQRVAAAALVCSPLRLRRTLVRYPPEAQRCRAGDEFY